MGTATITKPNTRSTSKAEFKDRDLPSPLGARNANTTNTGTDLRRHTAKSVARQKSVEKENVHPASKLTVASKIPTVVKGSKKRKETPAVISRSSEITDDERFQAAANTSSAEPFSSEYGEASMECDSRNSKHENEAVDLAGAVTHEEGARNTVPGIEAQGKIIASNAVAAGSTALERATAVSCTDNMRQSIHKLVLSNLDNGDQGTLRKSGLDQNIGSSQSGTSPLLSLLQRDYENLYKKYQKLKARRFEEVDALYEEQNSRITAHLKATQALVGHYQRENDSLRQQILETDIDELIKRSKLLEKAILECRNELVLEQSKNLELTQENKKLKSAVLEHIAAKNNNVEQVSSSDKPAEPPISTRTKDKAGSVSNSHSRLLQEILQHVLGLKLSFTGDGENARVQFEHGPTGFSFNLRAAHDADIAEVVEGGELMYESVSLGVYKKVVDWMKEEEAVFGMAQTQLLFKRLLRFLQQGA